MKAVAMITPEPKYLTKKNAPAGMLNLEVLLAKTGKTAPIWGQHR